MYDVIFCTNQNGVSGVDVSLFGKCRHNVVYGKVHIRVPLPPIFVNEVWDYSKTNVENINKAISNFN